MSSIGASSTLTLRMTLEKAAGGYWDGGAKSRFDFSIDRFGVGVDIGYARVGTWEGNHWFWVKMGKTEKQTLANARRHLTMTTRAPIKSFEYIEEDKLVRWD